MLKIKENLLWFEANSLLVSLGNVLDKGVRQELYEYVHEVKSEAGDDEAYKVVEKIIEFIKQKESERS
jgi:hypothetical protein